LVLLHFEQAAGPLKAVGEYLVLVPQVNRPYQGHHQQQAEEQSAQAPVDR
jgi:hypothetical protein